MFRFESPGVFFWLWIIPLVLGFNIWLVKKHKSKLEKVFGDRIFPFLSKSLSENRRRLKITLEALVLVFAVVALARPQSGTDSEEIKSEGVEMILAVDVSTSMLAEDVKPSRLEFAKREMFRLVDNLVGDKIGIVAFAGSAALTAPMTTDRAALKMFIESLSTTSVSSQGTEFRRALEESKDAFKRGGVEKDEETSVTRVIVLISDGEDNEPGAIAAAEELKKSGIRIFSLAFGTEKGAPIPVRDSAGMLRGYKRDRSGKTILSQTKGSVLKKLAQTGGGSFHHVTFGGDAISQLTKEISELEKSEFESQLITNYSEKYQLFLFLGLLLALIEWGLGERYRGREVWQGRFEVPLK